MNPWLLLIIPIASAVIIQLGLKRNATASACSPPVSGVHFHHRLSLIRKEVSAAPIEWIDIAGLKLDIGLQLDSLSKGMMIVVTAIGMLVHVFSLGYMKDDEAKARYFGCLSLFMFSMTGIVLASNFVMMFIFWELVGLSSYLLIGHWYHKDSAADAAKKAFLTNRIGDFGFHDRHPHALGHYGHRRFCRYGWQQTLTLCTCLTGMVVLLIFCGAVGKSAQLTPPRLASRCHGGPTPVSALIHAATMVAAGVYMMARLFLSLGITPDTASSSALPHSHRLGRSHHLATGRLDGHPTERHQKNPRLLDPLAARLHGHGRRPC